jgi:hypothetical protein
VVSYVESGNEESEEEVFKPAPRTKGTRGRTLKRKRSTVVSDEEDFANASEDMAEEIDEG